VKKIFAPGRKKIFFMVGVCSEPPDIHVYKAYMAFSKTMLFTLIFSNERKLCRKRNFKKGRIKNFQKIFFQFSNVHPVFLIA
jgi:hypothetical protein